MAAPQTRYAKSPRGYIAYQVVGEGPLDLVYMGGLVSQLDLVWEFPEAERYFQRLASFGRLILFDRRGTGISDPLPLDVLPGWDEWSEDLRTVMDAAGCKRAALLGERDSGGVAMQFAARYPDLVSNLILANSSARFAWAKDYPCGEQQQVIDQLEKTIRQNWGTERMAALAMPSRANDVAFLRVAARFQRASATPNTASKQYRYFFDRDVREALPKILCPTLIMHRREYPFLKLDHARYLQHAIKGSKLIEIEGGDSFFSHDRADEIMGYIEEFLTGERRRTYADRALTTVLFVDIANSTRLAAKLGDAAWRDLAARFHAMVRAQLQRYRGREVDSAGDGFFATFDVPGQGIRAARAIREEAANLGVPVRAGLHTGECEVADGLVRGMAVHIGARVAAKADKDQIWVSSTVKDLVTGGEFEFIDRGKHVLKGVPGLWRLHALADELAR